MLYDMCSETFLQNTIQFIKPCWLFWIRSNNSVLQTLKHPLQMDCNCCWVSITKFKLGTLKVEIKVMLLEV